MEGTITIDEEELDLIDLYEAEFKEVPFIAFLHPDVSKKLLRKALRSKEPIKYKEIA